MRTSGIPLRAKKSALVFSQTTLGERMLGTIYKGNRQWLWLHVASH